MSHMVIYRGADGKPGYHQTDDIHDAVGFVEQMRNEEGVEHARIFRLEEVVFEYRPYYRVELAGGAAMPASLSALNGAEGEGMHIAASSGAPANAVVGSGVSTAPAQPLNAVGAKAAPAASEAIELPDDVIEVIDGLDDQASPDLDHAGKSLFGR